MMTVVKSIWNFGIKNLMSFLLLVACVNFCTLAKAGNDNAELVYCPAEINCETDKELDSCTYEEQKTQHWDKVIDQGNHNVVVAGKYRLYSVSAPYHTNQHTTSCQYNSVIKNINNLYIKEKAASNLEINYEPTTQWRIGRTIGYCDSEIETDCPLKEQSSVLIHNATEVDLGLYFHDDPTNFSIVINPGEVFSRIRYDDLGFCKDLENCTIGIASKYGVIGKVQVDMNNGVKIKSITADDYSVYNISKVENFNAIEIKNTNTYPWFYICIKNFINSGVHVRVNEKEIFDAPLKNGEKGKAYYQAVYKNCNSFEICTLEILNASGLKIGKVVVDMQNNMSLLEVISYKPSEIILVQNGERVVEVKYTNLMPLRW